MPMTSCFAPTLNDLLADPLVLRLMSADHVDAASLKRDMTETAKRIGARPLGVDFNRARVHSVAGSRPAALPLPRVYAGCGTGLCG